MNDLRRIAYFSMEIALTTSMPTYSGGLGALAGDTIRSAADLGLPLRRRDAAPSQGLLLPAAGCVGLADRAAGELVRGRLPRGHRGAGQRRDRGADGPVAGVAAGRAGPQRLRGPGLPSRHRPAGERAGDRNLTHFLYGGDLRYRLCQEVILGIGGVRMLRALGYDGIRRYHMNEGHAALLTLELLRERREQDGRRYRLARGSRGRPSPVRLHDPHAGPGRARPVPAGAGGPGAGQPGGLRRSTIRSATKSAST